MSYQVIPLKYSRKLFEEIENFRNTKLIPYRKWLKNMNNTPKRKKSSTIIALNSL